MAGSPGDHLEAISKPNEPATTLFWAGIKERLTSRIKFDTARRSDAEVGPKECRLAVARKRPVCGVVGPQRIHYNTPRPSALHPGLFLAFVWPIGF